MTHTKYLEDLHQLAMLKLLINILFLVLPLKAKAIAEFSVLISLSHGILLYYAEKSYVQLDLAAFQLLSFFKVSITCLFFWISQKRVNSKSKT